MLRLLLFPIIAVVLSACTSSTPKRLISYNCEYLNPRREEWRITLDELKQKLQEAESLVAYHLDQKPWVFDRDTGDLYEYDRFEESFVPIKDLYTTGDESSRFRGWTEYKSSLSKNGTMLSITSVDKSFYQMPFESEKILHKTTEVYDIENNTAIFDFGEKTETEKNKCILIPTEGLDVQWLKTEGA